MDEDRLSLSPFDPAEYLKSEEAIAEYLRLSSDDTPEQLIRTLDTVARARAALRKETAPAPMDGNQPFNAVVGLAHSMGFGVTFTPNLTTA